MKKILFIILLLAQIQARGQTTLERRTINAQSGTAPVYNFFVSWSIGEPAIGVTQAGSFILTQGFLQPNKKQSITPPPTTTCTQYIANNTNQRCAPSTYVPLALQLGTELLKIDDVIFQKKSDNTGVLRGTFRDANWRAITVVINLEGYSTTATANKTGCLTANSPTSDWFFYTFWSGTIQRIGQAVLNISGSTPMQIGTGASTQDVAELGGYGKFIVANSTQTGQFNFKLNSPTNCPTVLGLNSQSVFTASGQNIFNKIKLNWYENTAQLGEFFKIEKINGAGDFELLDLMSAKLGTSLRDYVLLDTKPIVGENIYRITLSKNDGTEKQSGIIKVMYDASKSAVLILPNPTDGSFDVLLKTDISEESILRIYNSIGQQMNEVKTINASIIHFDLSDAPVGLYTVRVSQKNKFDVTQKVILQK